MEHTEKYVTLEQLEDDTYRVSPPDYTLYDGDAHEDALADAEAVAAEFAAAYGCAVRRLIPGEPVPAMHDCIAASIRLAEGK